MKKCFCFLSFCLFFWGCNLVPKEELYKIEHNGNTIIVQRVMGNATSANLKGAHTETQKGLSPLCPE